MQRCLKEEHNVTSISLDDTHCLLVLVEER
jgi:hypothetical protein